MAFNEEIKRIAMVACGRKCCICHKFCGNNMEVHHIKAHADGGEDTIHLKMQFHYVLIVMRLYDNMTRNTQRE